MTEHQHESEDLEDYEVLDSSDTLAGSPGDDPLDRGVVTPERWSAPIRSGGTADEQAEGESLDDLLAEEEPDVNARDYGDDDIADLDENAPGYDVRRFLSAEGPDERACLFPRMTTTRASSSTTGKLSDVTPGSTAAGRQQRKRLSMSWTTRRTQSSQPGRTNDQLPR